MDVLDNHLRAMSLKEYREMIKTLKLRKELPKNYSKLPKTELYTVVKPLLKSINDGEKIFINKTSNNLLELKPREVKSRVKKTQERLLANSVESEKMPENTPSKIPKPKKQVPKFSTGGMVSLQSKHCETKEEVKQPKRVLLKKAQPKQEVAAEVPSEPPKTPRRTVKEAVAKIESQKC